MLSLLNKLVPWLLASSSPSDTKLRSRTTTTTTTSAKKWSRPLQDFKSPYDLSAVLLQVYVDLEQPGNTYKAVTPNLRFSYVPPSMDQEKREKGEDKAEGDDEENETFSQDNTEHHHTSNKPVALYLPGLDGYGIGAARNQFDDLSQTFEFWRMTVLKDDRTPFLELVNHITDFVWALATSSSPAQAVSSDATTTNSASIPQRSVTLIGESCGGLLAAAVAIQLETKHKMEGEPNPLKGLVLVNPATSFDQTDWDALVPLLTSLPTSNKNKKNNQEHDKYDNTDDVSELSPYAVIGSLTLSALIPDSDQRQRILNTITSLPTVPARTLDDVRDVLGAMSQSFLCMEQRLPADLLRFRIDEWLNVGDEPVRSRLSTITVPTLVVVGEQDVLMPSAVEGKRLLETIPTCQELVVPSRGHFVLDETVNLTEAILYSQNIDPLNWKETKKKYDPILDWKLPPPEQIDEAIEQQVKPLRQAFSPIFFSTDKNGKRWKGLSKLPEKTRSTNPILFVGNHQLLALDLGLIVSEVYNEKGWLPRGLGHPIIFQATNATELMGRIPGLNRRQVSGPAQPRDFQRFGAVQVSPLNYYRLLQSNQPALLFPGGAQESLTGDTDYPLFWPDKMDFVRTAARFNATIVPFSAIGMVDSAKILAKYEDLKENSFLRSWFAQQQEQFQAGTSGVSAARIEAHNRNETDLKADLVFPTFPQRNYILFGKARSTTNLDHNDLQSCQQLYEMLYQDVRSGLDDLLVARKQDPFAYTPKRFVYEQLWGKQAPTFSMEALQKKQVKPTSA